MPTEVIAALIALVGVLGSAYIAFVVSRKEASVQIRNLHLQLEHQYTKRLFDKRLEVYPELHGILHELGEVGRDGGLSAEYAYRTLSKLHTWDRRNGLYLSAYSTRQLLALRALLGEALDKGGLDTRDPRIRRSVVEVLTKFEIALRTELGVFASSGYHNPADVKSLSSVLKELHDEQAPQKVRTS